VKRVVESAVSGYKKLLKTPEIMQPETNKPELPTPKTNNPELMTPAIKIPASSTAPLS
jgi:hypothetical protein